MEAEIINEIILKIDIPYFKNQENYLKLWTQIYESNHDLNILLLMYHKKIGDLHHYMYLKLYEHYINLQNTDVCKYLLNRALKKNVYERELIVREYNKLKDYVIKKDQGEIYRILNPKQLNLWGREWVEKKEIIESREFIGSEWKYKSDGMCFDSQLQLKFNDRNTVLECNKENNLKFENNDDENKFVIKKDLIKGNNTESRNAEKITIKKDCDRKKIKVVNNLKNTLGEQDDLQINITNHAKNIAADYKALPAVYTQSDALCNAKSLDFETLFEEEEPIMHRKARKSEIEAVNILTQGLFDNEDNENQSSLATNSNNHEFVIKLNDYVQIDKFIYFIKDMLIHDVYKLTRIVETRDVYVTTKVKTLFFIKFEARIRNIIEYNQGVIIPEIDQFCSNSEGHFVMVNDNSCILLSKLFLMLIKEHGKFNEDILAYFYFKVLTIVRILDDSNLRIKDLGIDSFCVDKENKVFLLNYKVTEDSTKYEFLNDMLNFVDLYRFKYIKDFDVTKYERLEADLKGLDFSEEFRQLKMLRLQNS